MRGFHNLIADTVQQYSYEHDIATESVKQWYIMKLKVVRGFVIKREKWVV